ncbi:MAG: hypothetical protein IJ011_02995 [Clostridia bacterium]|nr:hypothetical protein [Clostridia bacterium]
MKSKSGFIQKIAIGVVCVVIFSYTVYHVASIFGEDISTYAAGITTERTALSYNGYLFRDEQLLTSSNTGVVDYKVADGTKVSEGQQVAVVYSESRSKQNRISDLDGQIRILEESIEGMSENTDIVAVRAQNSDTYDAIVKLLAASETGGLSYQAEKLLVGMNRASAISGSGESDANETLEALYAERERIFSESGDGEICETPSNGYFFSGADGCEEYFTMSALKDLTVGSFAELVAYAESAETPEDAYGRLTDSSEWGIVLPIGASDKKYFTAGNTYSALFSENNQTSIPLYLERVIEEGSEVVLLVFSCDRQPENFSFNRCQSVSLTLSTVSGIYVPKSVVVKDDGNKGVYILRGSVVHFRYIEVIYEGSDYYLVAANAEHTEDRTYLRSNDMIILNGKNLFDGRVLD